MKPDKTTVPQIAKTVWHEFWGCKHTRNKGHRNTQISKERVTPSCNDTAFCGAIANGVGESSRATECKANQDTHIAMTGKPWPSLAYVTSHACQHNERYLCVKCPFESLRGTVLGVLGQVQNHNKLCFAKISPLETELHVPKLLLIIRSTLTKVAC